MWKKNITKQLKNEGKEYTSSKSKNVVAEKKLIKIITNTQLYV